MHRAQDTHPMRSRGPTEAVQRRILVGRLARLGASDRRGPLGIEVSRQSPLRLVELTRVGRGARPRRALPRRRVAMAF